MNEQGSWIKRLGRPVAIWFGSFLVAATFLMVYWKVPLIPILFGGALTLALTVARSSRNG